MTQSEFAPPPLSPPSSRIEFIDLKAQQARIREGVERRIRQVLDHGHYILGPEVEQLEEKLSDFCGARSVISCSSGTDALLMPMLAMGIGRGDAVFVPSFTFTATAEVVVLCGASPVFVDVDPDTYTMDPTSLEEAIEATLAEGQLTPKAMIPVDLFGIPANYGQLEPIAKNHQLLLIGDGAQSFGAIQHGKRVGALTGITATSFFPAKPLGCYGDGGAIFLLDDAAVPPEMDANLRSLRVHGSGKDKYDTVRIGLNARLDTMQAAVLIEKLSIFEEELQMRHVVAERYSQGLHDVVHTPSMPEGHFSSWAQYTIRCDRRDELRARLKDWGIPTNIYYPKPMHRQQPYSEFPCAPRGLAVSEQLSANLLSLPMHPYLDLKTETYIIACIRQALA